MCELHDDSWHKGGDTCPPPLAGYSKIVGSLPETYQTSFASHRDDGSQKHLDGIPHHTFHMSRPCTQPSLACAVVQRLSSLLSVVAQCVSAQWLPTLYSPVIGHLKLKCSPAS